MLNRNEVNLVHLMVVALFERGRPMTTEEIAERLTEAGAVARSGDMVLALKKAWARARTRVSRSRKVVDELRS